MWLNRLRGFLRRRWRVIVASLAAAVVLAAAGVFVTGYVTYRKVAGEVHHVTVRDLGKRPPVYSTTSENIMIVGSDSRAGLDHHQQVLLHTGDDDGDNTDTIMLVHISPGRHLMTVMSIPRDTMVPYYQCDSGAGYAGQQADPNDYERINAVLAAGGPSCLWKTVEQQTGIRVDHFMEIGMAGFVNVVDDLGGVTVCVPFAVNDLVSGLNVPSGEQHIDGITALAFWRTREDIGEGSDLQRIQRDQFMSAQIVKGVLSSGLLSNPLKLVQVASDLAPNLTVDSGMSTSDLVSLGESLRNLAAGDVQFVTAPVGTYPPDPNEVELSQPAADTMFAAIAHDTSIPDSAGTATASPSASAGAPALDVTPTATPEATGTSGAQADRAAKGGTSSTPTPTPTSGVTGTAGASGSASPSPSSSASSGIQSLAANNDGITGAAACSSDASAFAGPNSP